MEPTLLNPYPVSVWRHRFLTNFSDHFCIRVQRFRRFRFRRAETIKTQALEAGNGTLDGTQEGWTEIT